MKTLLTFLSLVLILSSCTKEVDRVNLLEENTKEVFFELTNEETVTLFADIDIEFIEKPSFVYHCSFYKEGELMFEGGTDPLITTQNKNESKTSLKGITRWKYYGKLEGDLKAKIDGEYSIKTTFLRNQAPNLVIHKADIVFVK